MAIRETALVNGLLQPKLKWVQGVHKTPFLDSPKVFICWQHLPVQVGPGWD